MQKKSYRFLFDSPVIVLFVLSGLAVFTANIFLKGNLIPTAFVCRSLKNAENAFDFKNALDYARIFAHVLANTSWTDLLLNSVLLLALGAQMEDRYGSPMILLMIIITTLVSGVLSVCVPAMPITGATSVIFMLITLSSLTALGRKEIPISWLLILVMFTAYKVYQFTVPADKLTDGGIQIMLNKNIPVFVDLAGGISGSLLGFLIAPKNGRKVRKAERGEPENTWEPDDSDWSSAKTVAAPPAKQKKQKKQKKAAPSDVTVVDDMEF